MPQSFRLSVAELAFALANSGALEAGFAYLQTVLGDIEPERFADWMTVASHSLIARGLLDVQPDGSYGELNSDLQLIARAMVRDERTLRCHRAQQGPDGAIEQYVSILFDADVIVAHWIEQSVVASVEVIPSLSDATAKIALFIGAQANRGTLEEAREPQTIPVEQLGRLRQAAHKLDAGQMREKLRPYVDAIWLSEFAATLTAADAVWGDVLRIERVNEEVVAERGFLFVSSSDAAWLLQSFTPDGSLLEILPASQLAVAAASQNALA